MRSIFSWRVLLVAALALCCWGIARHNWGQVVDNSASTAGESWARGMSSVISAQGDYNLSTSQAAINLTQAERQEIDNRKQWTDTYFQMRETNRAYQAKERGPPPSMEQLVRFAQMGKPKPLSPGELNQGDGRILWPSALRQASFSEDRQQLDAVFAKRSVQGGIGVEEQMEIRRLTASMITGLKQQIGELPPAAYIDAKKFLESLSYESQKRAT